MSYGFTRSPSPAQQRRNKARRLVNLTIHEVSSVDRGAGPGCEVLLRKRDEGVTKMEKRGGTQHPVNDLPADKMASALGAAYRVSKLMSLDKLFKDHSSGKIDGALMSEGIRKLADAEYPNDPRAMAKYEKAHREEFAEKLRADYAQAQKRSAGYGQPLGIGSNWNGAVGNGQGVHPDAAVSDIYSRTAANLDGTEHRWTDGSVDKRHPEMITAENVAKLQNPDPSLTFDAAVTMLSRGGK
jgi:hypothetical protein